MRPSANPVRLACTALVVGTFVWACSSYDEEGSSRPSTGNDGGGASSSGGGSSSGGTNDSGASGDGGGSTGVFALACGASTCEIGDSCCVTPPAGGLPIKHECVDPGIECSNQGAARMDCDDDVDCADLGSPGAVCCGAVVPNASPTRLVHAKCTAPTNCAVLPEDYRMCDPLRTDQCPNAAPCIQIKMIGTAAVTTPFYACSKSMN